MKGGAAGKVPDCPTLLILRLYENVPDTPALPADLRFVGSVGVDFFHLACYSG